MHKKYRRDGIIPTLKTSTYPHRLLFFDTETTPIITDNGDQYQKLRLGVARYIQLKPDLSIQKDEQITFYSTDEFMDFTLSHVTSKKKLLIYAHNIAFDIMVLNLPQYFLSLGIETQPPIINGMMFLWKVKTDNGTLEFINTGNYCPYPLAKIGDDLHIPKLSIDFNTDDENSLIEYCQRDVEILKELILRFITFLKSHNLGSYKSTIASQALTTYRTSFMTSDIHIHTDIKVNTIERDSYHGGRTEAFYIGDLDTETTYYLDINSMYPYVMKGDLIPVEYLFTIPNPDISLVQELLDTRYLIARCTINTDENYLPLKYNPLKHKILNTDCHPKHSKLIFPIGHFETILHHSELKYALEHNHIHHIHGLYIYRKEQIFDEYVNFFNTLKIESGHNHDATNRLMSKLLMNSLYGKFGQQYKATELIQANTQEPNSQTLVITKNLQSHFIEFVWFNKRYRGISEGESTYAFPAIAGAITAKARMLLWHYMKIAGLDNVYYCDTDSIITNSYGYDRLIQYTDDYELGKLALEKQTEYMRINGAKDYTWDTDRVVKGVPKKASWLNDSVSLSTRFQGFKEWRNEGMETMPKVWQQLKIKRNPYDKGVITSTGKVLPYKL